MLVRKQKQKASGQTDLFNDSVAMEGPKIQFSEPKEPIPQREQLLWERELLGIYISQHPLASFELLLSEHTVPGVEIKAEYENKTVSVGGAVVDIREISTKNGQKMAFVKIADKSADFELVLFPNVYQQTVGIWERDRVILAKGKVSTRDRDGNSSQEVKILVDDAREVTEEQALAYQATGKAAKRPKPSVKSAENKVESTELKNDAVKPKLYIRLKDSKDHKALISIKKIVDTNQGESDVVFVLGPDEQKQAIKLPIRVNATQIVQKELSSIIGSQNVKLQ